MSIVITKRPYGRSFSGNPVHYELTSATASTDSNIFFEFRLMFRLIGDALFTEVGRMSWFPTGGVAEINVQDMLHSQLIWQVPAFPADEKTVQRADQQTGQFYIEFREITPTDQNPAFDTSELDFIRTIIRGGINFFKWAGNNFWVNYYNVKKPFLTWQLNGRLSGIQERMYLGYLCNDDGMTSVVIRARVTYLDLSQDLVELPFSPVLDCLYYVPSGAFQWGFDQLAAAAGKSIYYWEIFIVNLSDPASPQTVSEVFKYYADNRNNLNDITLHYRNSLGGLDSVNVRGVVDESLDYNYQEQDITFKPDYFDSHVITAQKLITETQEQQTWKGDIGYLEKEEQDRLRDAQIQRDVYMKTGSKWWPINIITKNLKLKSTGDMKFSLPIEFTLGYGGSGYYTPKSIDLGDGVFTSNVCQAYMYNVDFSISFTDPNATAGNVVGTLSAQEADPQNASTKFHYRINGGAWVDANYSDLPLKIQVPANQANQTLEYQTICTGDIVGKKNTVSFTTVQNAPAPPPVFPITTSQVSSTGTPGSTSSQVFEFTGVNVGDVLPAGVIIQCGVYSHDVIVGPSNGTTDTLNSMLDQLVAAVNATTTAQWNSSGSAPAPGTPGFPPRASHTSGSNRITLTLNYQNSFYVWAHFQ